ncbi:GNAT family protein [Dyadobacter sp. LHD-138]|uniref:GNAT family N-acetyltransferase n=1 Tax=Dyadobacter sp. LHD-138 TaxID=3071413 RepID=UPI0027DF94DD|nr:GNAT family protein [Dyadobacter sp. LHD-138]MDQ6477931.1 GNAT family protein [Dyadobacter sp. LHD-138]
MIIVEITAENNYSYHDFFTTGLVRHSNCFKLSPDEQQENWFPTKGTPYSFTIAMLDEFSQLMGVVSFQRLMENRKKLRHKGELFRMYVSRENGGKNIGNDLITYVVNRVKEQLPDIEQINLNVATNNEKAKNLYKKLGFEHFGTECNAIKFEGNYYDDDYMALKLINRF